MELRKLSDREYRREAFKLYKKNKPYFKSFNGFDLFNRKALRGKFKFQKGKSQTTHWAGLVNGQVQCLTSHFKIAGYPDSLGQFLFDPEVTQDSIEKYFGRLKEKLNAPVVAPLNGHPNLGFTYPDHDFNPTFLTSSTNSVVGRIFSAENIFSKKKKYYSYTMKVTEALKGKLESGLSSVPPEFTTRNISRIHFKRDVAIYNRLLAVCMGDHENFIPLEVSEEWDLMKESLLILEPKFFKFLLYQGREIGFCFGIPDFNQILKNDNDVKNFIRILFKKGRITRGRIIYSGILPDFQGQGLFKFVRHRVIQEMINQGYNEIESSYIDEVNVKSLKNVESTGAVPSGTFSLFELR